MIPLRQETTTPTKALEKSKGACGESLVGVYKYHTHQVIKWGEPEFDKRLANCFQRSHVSGEVAFLLQTDFQKEGTSMNTTAN
jgi:hypothetical protein